MYFIIFIGVKNNKNLLNITMQECVNPDKDTFRRSEQIQVAVPAIISNTCTQRYAQASDTLDDGRHEPCMQLCERDVAAPSKEFHQFI